MDRLYDELTRQLDFPEYFGRNLDALWDVLTGDVEGPITIAWPHGGESARAIGSDYDKLVALFQDVARSRPDFTFEIA